MGMLARSSTLVALRADAYALQSLNNFETHVRQVKVCPYVCILLVSFTRTEQKKVWGSILSVQGKDGRFNLGPKVWTLGVDCLVEARVRDLGANCQLAVWRLD